MRIAIATLMLLILLPPAARAQQAESEAREPTAVFEMQVEWSDQTRPALLALYREGEAYGAAWQGPRGTLAARDVQVTDSTIAFVLEVQDQAGQAIALRYEGQLDGDELVGRLVLPNGQAVPASGRRRAEEKAPGGGG